MEIFNEIDFLFFVPTSMADFQTRTILAQNVLEQSINYCSLQQLDKRSQATGKNRFDPFISWHPAVFVGMSEKLLANVQASSVFTIWVSPALASLGQFSFWQLLSNSGFFRWIKEQKRAITCGENLSHVLYYWRRGLIVYISWVQTRVTEEYFIISYAYTILYF